MARRDSDEHDEESVEGLIIGMRETHNNILGSVRLLNQLLRDQMLPMLRNNDSRRNASYHRPYIMQFYGTDMFGPHGEQGDDRGPQEQPPGDGAGPRRRQCVDMDGVLRYHDETTNAGSAGARSTKDTGQPEASDSQNDNNIAGIQMLIVELQDYTRAIQKKQRALVSHDALRRLDAILRHDPRLQGPDVPQIVWPMPRDPTFTGDFELGYDRPIPGTAGRWEFYSHGDGSAEDFARRSIRGGQTYDGFEVPAEFTAEDIWRFRHHLIANGHGLGATAQIDIVWVPNSGVVFVEPEEDSRNSSQGSAKDKQAWEDQQRLSSDSAGIKLRDGHGDTNGAQMGSQNPGASAQSQRMNVAAEGVATTTWQNQRGKRPKNILSQETIRASTEANTKANDEYDEDYDLSNNEPTSPKPGPSGAMITTQQEIIKIKQEAAAKGKESRFWTEGETEDREIGVAGRPEDEPKNSKLMMARRITRAGSEIGVPPGRKTPGPVTGKKGDGRKTSTDQTLKSKTTAKRGKRRDRSNVLPLLRSKETEKEAEDDDKDMDDANKESEEEAIGSQKGDALDDQVDDETPSQRSPAKRKLSTMAETSDDPKRRKSDEGDDTNDAKTQKQGGGQGRGSKNSGKPREPPKGPKKDHDGSLPPSKGNKEDDSRSLTEETSESNDGDNGQQDDDNSAERMVNRKDILNAASKSGSQLVPQTRKRHDKDPENDMSDLQNDKEMNDLSDEAMVNPDAGKEPSASEDLASNRPSSLGQKQISDWKTLQDSEINRQMSSIKPSEPLGGRPYSTTIKKRNSEDRNSESDESNIVTNKKNFRNDEHEN